MVRFIADSDCGSMSEVSSSADFEERVNLTGLDPVAEIDRCILETQRQMQRLEEIVRRLAAPHIRDNLASMPAVALFLEGNLRLKHELDEFELDSLALVTIARSHAPQRTGRLQHRASRGCTVAERA